MSRGNFRVAPFAVIFDGQSLNNYPAAPGNYPTLLMANYPSIAWKDDRDNVAVDGLSWTTLATTASTRLHPFGKGALTNILIMCGGTSDIWAGDSAATLYADHLSYANNARAAGFDKVIVTTLVGNILNTTPNNTQRLAFNDLLRLPQALIDFDGIADVAVVTGLDNHLSSSYDSGHIHWSSTGAAQVVTVVKPVLDTFMI